MQDYPEKDSYKLSELCQYTDTQPYVIRFWESEFPQFREIRGSTGGQRVYRKEDIDLVRRIKQLLYEEEYTLAAAREQLDEERGGDGSRSTAKAALRKAARTPEARERGPKRQEQQEQEEDVAPPRPVAVASQPAVSAGESVPRDRYDRAVEEIELLRLKLKEAEREVRRADAARIEAEERAERDRQARQRAANQIEVLIKGLGSGEG